METQTQEHPDTDAADDDVQRGDSIQIDECDSRPPRELPGLGPWRGLYPEGGGRCLGKYVHLQVPVQITRSDGEAHFWSAGDVIFHDGERYLGFEKRRFADVRQVIEAVGAASANTTVPALSRVDHFASRLMKASQAGDRQARSERNRLSAQQAVEGAEALVEALGRQR